jgi:hypothetical protein
VSHAEPMLPGATGPALPSAAGRDRWWSRHLVWTAVIVAVALRLPFVASPASPDEAGFLEVAGQWSSGGGSLYGRYWVDRPPLLITLFQVAESSGGLVALRLLGCLAVALTILLGARSAELVAGPRASRWTAATAAALLVAPQLGSQHVNGELLAAPFVAGGILALITAVRFPESRWAAVGGGAAGMCAVLVKQNMLDVAVFAVALLGAVWWRGRSERLDRVGPQVVRFVAGAVAAALVASAWMLANGTSPVAVLHAMYPFRVQAARALSDGGGLVYAHARAGSLARAWLTSGLAVLTVAVVSSASRWRRSPVMIALAATMAFDLVSVAVGGAYWSHYLIEMIVPLSIAVGVLAAQARRVAVGAALATLALAGVPAVHHVVHVPTTSTADEIGTALAGASRPGDTLTTLYGQAQVNRAAGLASPYPHLWSLPVKTLDPGLTELQAVLAGPDAPTWLLVARRVSSWGLDASRARRVIAARYHPVARYDGQTIYLRDGLRRPTPLLSGPGTQNTP